MAVSPLRCTGNEVRRRRAEVVIAGNRFIAERMSDHCRDVRIVPTAIDTDRFQPLSTKGTIDRNGFVIGWTGQSSNYFHLETILEPLKAFLKDHKDAGLLVIADRAPDLPGLSPERVNFIPWNVRNEVEGCRPWTSG